MLCFTAPECGLFFPLVHVSVYENIQQNIHRKRSFVSLRDGYWPVFHFPFFLSFRPSSSRLLLSFFHCRVYYFKLPPATLVGYPLSPPLSLFIFLSGRLLLFLNLFDDNSAELDVIQWELLRSSCIQFYIFCNKIVHKCKVNSD